MEEIRHWVRDLSVIEEVDLAFRFLDAVRIRGTMIDVGAHQGGSLRRFAGQGWTIHAFEPDPRNQKALGGQWASCANVKLNQVAVGKEDRSLVSFAVSSNSFIGSLTPFDESHSDTISVPLITLATYCADCRVDRVDFLKTDAEGHDLDVLRGFPWEVIKPRLIISEFEDKKRASGEGRFQVMADFLVGQGYRLLISEWYPVVTYTGPFRWRRFFAYPDGRPKADGNGNILAVRGEEDWRRLRRLCAAKAVMYRAAHGIRVAYGSVKGVLGR